MNTSERFWKSRQIEHLISDLRTEVRDQKECITRYVLQAIAFAGVMWGIAFNASTKNGLAFYVCGVITVTLFLMISRLATHKYTTVNRNLGYELHLNRVRDYARLGNKAWAQRMLSVGWEEAICAWRIVQPTLFEHLYHSKPQILPHRIRLHHCMSDYPWYNTWLLIDEATRYHPGSYFRNVQRALFSLCGLSLGVMWYTYLEQMYSPSSVERTDLDLIFQYFIIYILLALLSLFVLVRVIRDRSFRKILEGELLSIQSCAVLWRLVVTCHILASEMAFKKHDSYKCYTVYTSMLARDITKSFYGLHDWLAEWERAGDTEDVHERLDELLVKYPQPPR